MIRSVKKFKHSEFCNYLRNGQIYIFKKKQAENEFSSQPFKIPLNN